MSKVIDISAWQDQDIDWFIAKSEIRGVILKLCEIKNNQAIVDEMFVRRANELVEAGIPFGVYVYTHANTVDQALDDANWVDNILRVYLKRETPTLGIWYDVEDDDMISGDVTAMTAAFINELNRREYTYVGVYSSWNWMSKEGAHILNLDALADYVPIWVAQYSDFNDLKVEYPNKNIKLWQYTDHETINGIPTQVDCNVMY